MFRVDMLRSEQYRRTRRRGQALLESALVLVTYFSMVIFILDMGRMLMTQQFLVDRARNAARWASLNNWDPNAVANVVCFNDPSMPAGSNGKGMFGLTPSMVNATKAGTPGAWDERVSVTISNYPMLTMIPFMAGNYTAAPVTVTVPVGSGGATN